MSQISPCDVKKAKIFENSYFKPASNNAGDDAGIKFHDPNEFRNQQPNRVPPHNPSQPDLNNRNPSRHHRHQHGAKINFEDENARE